MMTLTDNSFDYSDVTILVNSCDLYEDAWNPFFRLLQIQWPNCPKNIILNTESKIYKDSYFNVKSIYPPKEMKWGERLIYALNKIDSKYILFFLEDFFLLDKVNEEIIASAIKCMQENQDVGVIKFIPNIPENWYDKNIVLNDYFSPIPVDFRARNAGLAAIWRKDYYLKLLRPFEDPWEFELFGAIRSRKYPEKILAQNDQYPLAFPYNIQIKYGYGITQKKWLKNNKVLFDKYNIDVNYDNLGWYSEVKTEKVVGKKRSLKEKILMPILNPKTFFKILQIEIKQKIYYIRHIRNFF